MLETGRCYSMKQEQSRKSPIKQQQPIAWTQEKTWLQLWMKQSQKKYQLARQNQLRCYADNLPADDEDHWFEINNACAAIELGLES